MSRTRQKQLAIGERVAKSADFRKGSLFGFLMKKGAFLLRQFGNPRGRLLDRQGRSSPLALSALKFNESVPKNSAAAKKLGNKGRALLAQLRKKPRTPRTSL